MMAVLIGLALVLFVLALIDFERGRRIMGLCEAVVAGLLLLGTTSPAVAYPENVRQGYPSCAACHANGSGGGLLTLYGRAKAGSGLATWGSMDEAGFAHGAFGSLEAWPKWLLLGGDVRYLNLNVSSPRGDLHRKFRMHATGEVGLRLVPRLWLVASGGVYGENDEREYREHYLSLAVSNHVTLRAGRFLSVYGVGFDDHTLASRQALGFGEGREAYAAEASVRGKLGEVVVTQTFGADGSLAMHGADRGYEYGTRSETASLAKVAAFIGSSAQAGASYLFARGVEQDREAWGGFAIVAPMPWLYVMTDVNRQQRTGELAQLIATTVLGVEPYRGVTVAATHEQVGKDGEPVYGGQLRLTPRPHFEITGRVKRQAEVVTSLFVVHYYL